MRIRRWQDMLILILSIWLLASLWLLGYTDDAAGWNVLVTGSAMAVLALIALAYGRFWEDWVELALGIWLVISPWVVAGFVDAAHTWNTFLVGLAVAILAAWSLASRREIEHRPERAGPAAM